MLNKKKVVVVLPAYNAAKTLRRTVEEIPREIVDEVILTDDASRDHTSELALELGLITIRHDHNRGYGGNQKTCYMAALARGADIVDPQQLTEHGLARDGIGREVGVADDQAIAMAHGAERIEHVGIEQRINGLQHGPSPLFLLGPDLSGPCAVWSSC